MLSEKLPVNSNTELFRVLANEISAIASKMNVKIRPYRSPELPYFSKLTPQNQKEILGQLAGYIEICKNALSALGNTNFSIQMVWAALKQFNYIPCSDLFSKISPTDVIEIHDVTGKQVFRNFKYFEFCSYSLEDIHCVPWTELYYRPKENLGQIVDFVTSVLNNPPRNTITCNIEPHVLEETNSHSRLKMNYITKFYSPLFDNSGRMVAGMAIEAPELLTGPSATLPVMDHTSNNVYKFSL